MSRVPLLADAALLADAESDRHRSRVMAAFATIQQALKRRKRPYLAYSGGKDSTALLALVEAACPEIMVVWSDDELEYPESVALQSAVRDAYGDRYMSVLAPSLHAGWFAPWSDPDGRYWRDPLPGSVRTDLPHPEYMASLGYDLTFLGVRAAESQTRRDWLSGSGPAYRVKGGTGMHSCPLWDWTTSWPSAAPTTPPSSGQQTRPPKRPRSPTSMC